MQAAKGCALLSGRRFVLPDDVQRMIFPVLAHRLILRERAGIRQANPETVLTELLRTVPVPLVR